jgi:hypothetical protein
MARSLGDGTARPLLFTLRALDYPNGWNVLGSNADLIVGNTITNDGLLGPYKGLRFEFDRLEFNSGNNQTINIALRNDSNPLVNNTVNALGCAWITGGDAQYNSNVGTLRYFDNTQFSGHLIGHQTAGPITGWADMMFNWTGGQMIVETVSSTAYRHDSDAHNHISAGSRRLGPSGFNRLTFISFNTFGNPNGGIIKVFGIRA